MAIDYTLIKECVSALKEKFYIDKYLRIMGEVKREGYISQKTMDVFSDFYSIRMPKKWKENYFSVLNEYLKRKEIPSFSSVLNKISTDRCEASYASKLLHTVDDSKPLYDKYVRYALLIGDFEVDKDNKMRLALEIYNRIEFVYFSDQYSDFRNSMIRVFDDVVGEHTKISNVKKIDYVLWSMGQKNMFISYL